MCIQAVSLLSQDRRLDLLKGISSLDAILDAILRVGMDIAHSSTQTQKTRVIKVRDKKEAVPQVWFLYDNIHGSC